MEISGWLKLIKISLTSMIVVMVVTIMVFVPLRYTAYSEQFIYVWYLLLAWLLLSIALLGVGVLKLEKLYKAKSTQTPENQE